MHHRSNAFVSAGAGHSPDRGNRNCSAALAPLDELLGRFAIFLDSATGVEAAQRCHRSCGEVGVSDHGRSGCAARTVGNSQTDPRLDGARAVRAALERRPSERRELNASGACRGRRQSVARAGPIALASLERRPSETQAAPERKGSASCGCTSTELLPGWMGSHQGG